MLQPWKSVWLLIAVALVAMALPAAAAPALTSINPTSGYPGTQVTLTGTAFGASQGSGSVWLGSKLAGSIVSWSNTQIVAVVASGAASGSAQVQQGGVWSNSIAFTVIKPNITSINPTSGYPGTQVTITGTNFGATQGSGSVWLGNKLAGGIVSWSDTQIVATVAATALSGSAQVQQNGVWGNSVTFTVITPNVTSISPTTGYPGTQVTLNGTNFGASQGSGSVWLGNKLAGSIVSWSNTQIVAVVAATALSGSASVQQGGVWSNSITFTVITPNITNITPTSGITGTQVTITGTNFGASQGSGSVWLGSKLAGSIVSWSGTQVVATVASGAITGSAQVQQGGVWTSPITFTVVTPHVESIDPASGPVGTEVSITGTGFGSTQGSGLVWIGTKYATVVSWSDTLVVATVAAASETGGAQVYQNGVWSNAPTFEVVECPVAEDPDDLEPGDAAWIDDNGVPAGTTVGAEGIVWSTYQKMHGTMAFHAVDADSTTIGTRSVSFTGLNELITAEQTLFLDVLPENCGPASTQQIVVTWQTDAGPRTAYWGGNALNLGSEAVQISDELGSGYWQRLQVSPDDVDLVGRTVTGVTVEHVDGRVWFDYIGVNTPPPCGPPTPSDVTGTFNSGEVVFFEDAFPSGTVVDAPGVEWDTTFKAGGTQSFTVDDPDFNEPQQISLHGFDPAFWANRSDNLFIYVLVDPCHVPDQLRITWKTSLGDKVVWYGSQNPYGSGGLHAGGMPAAGQWVRLSVNLNSLNFQYGSVTGVVLQNYGGRVWWDHAGRTLGTTCVIESQQNRPNTRHNDDQLWFDDSFPAGAVVDAPGVTWTDRQRATGDLAFYATSFNVLQPQTIAVHDFTPIAIGTGAHLFAYVLQDPCNPPQEIVLTWQTSAGPKSAYWGDNPYNSTGVYAGPLPRLRFWERLEVPASLVDVEGESVSGVTIEQYGGHAWYDTVGARPECTLTEVAPATDFKVSDTVWIEDTTPAGFTAHDVDFTSDQKTSGSTSFTSTDSSIAGAHSFSFDFPENYLGYVEGDSIVFYTMLDPCNPPREVLVKFTTPEFTSAANYGDSILSGAINGDIFPSGVWHRVELPFTGYGLQTTNNLVNLEITTVDGRAWFDRLGKSCSAPPAQQNANLDDDDVTWFDGELPAGATATPGIVWEPERALNVTASFTSVDASTVYGTHTIDISDLDPHLIGANDALVFYAQTDHCPPTTRIAVTWHLESGQTRSAWWGGATGTGYHGGDVVLGWGHYYVPATALNMVGERVVGVTFVNEGGRASFNHVGVNAPSCFAPTATAPATMVPGDEAWFEDGWGNTAPQYVEGRWDPRQHASGTAAITSDLYGQYLSGYFGAQNFLGTPPPPLVADGEVVMWVFIDPCDVPQYFTVGFSTTLGDRSFHWGSFPYNVGTDMGAMPAAGTWARLAMPVDAALDGAVVTSIGASWYSARLWFDHIGANDGSCIATVEEPTLPEASQVWMEDAAPEGSTGSTGNWVTTQHASGTHSLQFFGAGQQSFEISVLPWTVAPSESLAFSMLVDPCKETPQEIIVSWLSNETGQWSRAFWGTDVIYGTAPGGTSMIRDMGAVPAASAWNTIELDPALIGLGTDSVIGLRVETVGGRVWFDRFGTTTH
jgi:IPT/TIG domain-containing protein